MSRAPTFVRHDGAGAFLHRAEPWLLRSEAEHNLALSLSAARVADPDESLLFATVEHADEVVGCVVRTPPHKLLVTRMPPEATDVVADAVAGIYAEVPAVLGPAEVATAVATGWSARRGGVVRPGMRQRIYTLERVVPPTRPASGGLRPARPEDLELACAWMDGFGDELGPMFRVGRAGIERWIGRGALHIWDDPEPVSCAVAQGRTRNGIRIGFVYTPPEHRRRGYASSTVAAISQLMLDGGVRFCLLYTDLSNPTSNAIYQEVGYRPLADVVDVEIVRGEVGD